MSYLEEGLRILLLIGSVVYLLLIFILLKRGKLNVQYSIIWLASALMLILFSAFPYLVSVLRYWLKIETSANFVFVALFAFVLLLLLSLSTIVTGFAKKIRKLTQTQALLERRIRDLEQQMQNTCADAPAEK